MAPDVVTIGRVGKAFGVQGEVRVEPLTDVPDRFTNLEAVTLVMPSGQSVGTVVTKSRKSGRFYIVGFSAFSSPEEAAQYTGALMQIPRLAVPTLAQDQYYQFELIGLSVYDATGQMLGCLEEVWEVPHQHLFVVRQGKKELLVPAVRHVVTNVDLEKGVMTVAPVAQWGILDAV